MIEQDGGADESDIYARQFHLDAYLVGSRDFEAYNRRVKRNGKNPALYVPKIKKRTVSFHRTNLGLEHHDPGQIDHFFHPSCPLFHQQNCRFRCSACRRNFYDHCYSCQVCNFHMDVVCALQAFPLEEGRVAHFVHPHPLLVLPVNHEENQLGLSQYGSSCCKICGEAHRVGDSACPAVCACHDCQFYVHKSCMDVLPREVQSHLFHKDCASPLVFMTRPRTLCDACDEHGSGLCYSCRDCGFSMCLECSLLNTFSREVKQKKKKIQHFFHMHTLNLVEKPSVGISCNACGKHAPPGLSYACYNCNFFLHSSCSKLPRKLRTSFHLDHPLVLKNLASHRLDSLNSKCILCLKDCREHYAYRCSKCNVLLDIECAFLKPTIEYQRHNHLLTVVEMLHLPDEFKCFACKKNRGRFPVFRCVECNFNLHLLCGPLPLEVKHKCHVHPLELLDYFVEDDRHDHCCHACELPRDADLCVYRCSDCPFIADVKCILSRIILSLRGANGQVMLRTVGKRIPSRLVIDSMMNESNRSGADARGYMITRHSQSSNHHVLKYFSMQEVSECSIDYVNGSLLCNLKFRGKTSLRIHEDSFSYSDTCFKQLTKRLKLNSLVWDNQLQNFVEEHNKFVTFRDYMFPETLIPILTRFLDKHGDVSVSAKAKGHNIRSVYFYLLCCVVESMSTTKLLDVTEDHLTNWYACLDKVKKAGFNIQVVFDHLDRVVRAHFGLRAQKFKDDTSNQLKGKIKSISDEIERLTRELEESRRSLDDHEKFVQRETTSLIKQCLKDASKMKYIYAATGLI